MRPKYGAKRDEIEPEIVKALEALGCTVYRMDVPVDLLVGYRARNFLLECKSDKTVRRSSEKNKKTEDQKDFFASWEGQVRIVESMDEAIQVVTGRGDGGQCTQRLDRVVSE